MDFLNSFLPWFQHTGIPLKQLSTFDMVLLSIKGFVSVIGTLVIVTGVIVGAYRFLRLKLFPERMIKKGLGVDFIRRDLGRTIVLGLEFIIAADVIETTTAPDYYSVGILAIVVMIRTFLSYTLNREINSLSETQKSQLRG